MTARKHFNEYKRQKNDVSDCKRSYMKYRKTKKMITKKALEISRKKQKGSKRSLNMQRNHIVRHVHDKKTYFVYFVSDFYV